MDMPVFRLYDTLSRTVKTLVTLEPNHLRFYSCGPTVYSYAHIGNFRTFLTGDLIVRTAKALGWKVSYVSNITDVGHLTADDVADATGEDKMEKALKSKSGEAFLNVWDLAAHYADAFKEDWDRLKLTRPMLWPRATEHMREQIVAVEKLIADGHAYETPTGVYFDTTTFARRGALSGNDADSLRVAVRDVVVDDNKKNPADFALWKKDEKHLMQWFSPWGWGFPGWHIECSVMAMQYLGETIDLHGGGEDLVFPHHECEMAQSESLTGHSFCEHWVHTKFLQFEGEKMSKSKGTFFTARELIDEKGIHPLALRYALMSVPYSKPANFTMDLLRDSASKIDRYSECVRVVNEAIAKGNPGADSVGEDLDRLYQETLEAMCEDLNTSVALAKALEGTSVIFRQANNLSAESADSAKEFFLRIGELLGIVPESLIAPMTANISTRSYVSDAVVTDANFEINALVKERDAAKAGKAFARADAIRAELGQRGIELRDTPEGTVWRRKSAEI